MREADKPSLAEAIWVTTNATGIPAPVQIEEMRYVIDGGALIQRLPWSQNETFDSICKSYVDYLGEKKYGNSAIIAFDGYSWVHLQKIQPVCGDLVVLWV